MVRLVLRLLQGGRSRVNVHAGEKNQVFTAGRRVGETSLASRGLAGGSTAQLLQARFVIILGIHSIVVVGFRFIFAAAHNRNTIVVIVVGGGRGWTCDHGSSLFRNHRCFFFFVHAGGGCNGGTLGSLGSGIQDVLFVTGRFLVSSRLDTLLLWMVPLWTGGHGRSRVVTGTHPFHGPKVGFLIGVGFAPNSGPLDLDALNLVGQIGFAPQKAFVVIAALVQALRNAFKAVEVQLSLKTGNLGQFGKVPGQEDLLKGLWIVNGKAATVGLPRNHVTVFLFSSMAINLIQHFVQLERKGRSGRSTEGGACLPIHVRRCHRGGGFGDGRRGHGKNRLVFLLLL